MRPKIAANLVKQLARIGDGGAAYAAGEPVWKAIPEIDDVFLIHRRVGANKTGNDCDGKEAAWNVLDPQSAQPHHKPKRYDAECQDDLQRSGRHALDSADRILY